MATPWQRLLERMRMRLAGHRGGLVLALLGLLSGLIAGGIIVAFRLLVETTQAGFLPHAGTENFEDLAPMTRLALAVGGGACLAVLLRAFGRDPPRTGVLHVMERLAYYEGHLPWRNAVLQFLGAALALVTGQSVGREGPSIHLGAAGGSLLGQLGGFPNNSIRALVGCGTAAAIAASFNTPLAGVIFAMEVVMMEYTIVAFTPVILAAVSATALSRLVFGAAPAFQVPQLHLHSMWELPYIVVTGICVGALAAAFIALLKTVTRVGQRWPTWARPAVAGLAVGACALAVPEVMSIGYDTVNRALLGDYVLGALLAIAAAKLLATAICVGLNVPGGLIGPSLVTGAAAGAALGLAGALLPMPMSGAGFYAMLGMGAMMGATLQAPLAALLALLELTGNPNIILPGMLAIVSAHLAARHVFGRESVFISQMRERGLDYTNNPVAQSLRRVGVTAVMSRSFRESPPRIDTDRAEALLEDMPQWIVVERDSSKWLLPAADLARCLEEQEQRGPIDLLELPGRRRGLATIHERATLQEGLEVLEDGGADALCVVRPVAPLASRTLGIVTRADIEATYRKPRAARAAAS